MGNIGVYWDFENIHASLCNLNYGRDWYRLNRNHKQPTVVDIDAIMEYVVSLGNVNINKAYANWSFFFPYNYDLQNHAVDLIQIFPRGAHGKNGADIRMAIDIIEDINQNNHIDTVVVVGGDSDYISIAQKVRMKGKEIVGIGVKETTNGYWINSCNEFKFYTSLLAKASTAQSIVGTEVDKSGLDDAEELLCKAMRALLDRSQKPQVLKALIKPMMTRLDSSFDEANFGFKNFAEFLSAFPKTVKVIPGQNDHMVSLTGEQCEPPPEQAPQIVSAYQAILKRQHVKMLPPSVIEAGTRETFNIFAEKGFVDSYEQYKDELVRRLSETGLAITEIDASKIKALIYKTFAFRLDAENSRITLSPDITSSDDLVRLYRKTIVKRILDNIEDEPDLGQLSEILFGDDGHREEADELAREYDLTQPA